jgi:hypothetical protein
LPVVGTAWSGVSSRAAKNSKEDAACRP